MVSRHSISIKLGLLRKDYIESNNEGAKYQVMHQVRGQNHTTERDKKLARYYHDIGNLIIGRCIRN